MASKGAQVEKGRSALEAVRTFLEKLNGRVPSFERLAEIERELEVLSQRLKKVQALGGMYRHIEFSDEVQMLLNLHEQRKHMPKRWSLRKAAGLL